MSKNKTGRFYYGVRKYVDFTAPGWKIVGTIIGVILLVKVFIFTLDIALDNHISYLDALETQVPEGWYEEVGR